MENGIVKVYFENRAHGDDAYITRDYDKHSSLDGVFDGVTSGGQGRIASALTKNRFRDANRIQSPGALQRLLQGAHQTLSSRKPNEKATTTATVALKIENILICYQCWR